MRLIVTGGGTGGHVYPALEVARHASERTVGVAYFGSLRGQEKSACAALDMPFHGFPSEPVFSVRTPAGWKSLARMFKARILAKKALANAKPDVVFSTGGYSSAPVVSAAQALGIPFVIHEQNSVPGRTNKLLSTKSYAVATTFRTTEAHFSGCNVVRTGLPVRTELREVAKGDRNASLIPLILVVGGSQGAMAVNEAAMGAAQRLTSRSLNWIHVTGQKNFESCYPSFEKLGLKDSYEMHAFLNAPEMAAAYAKATLVVGRSGASTLSELAAFRLPSLLVPYPHAHADHQAHNAKEFEEIGAGSIIDQSNLRPSELESHLLAWLENEPRLDRAANALAEWDTPDAVERIFELVQFAADSKPK